MSGWKEEWNKPDDELTEGEKHDRDQYLDNRMWDGRIRRMREQREREKAEADARLQEEIQRRAAQQSRNGAKTASVRSSSPLVSTRRLVGALFALLLTAALLFFVHTIQVIYDTTGGDYFPEEAKSPMGYSVKLGLAAAAVWVVWRILHRLTKKRQS